MKKEHVIETLKNPHWFFFGKLFESDFEQIADAIIALPLDVPGVSNWVAIKDALPNNNEEVLTITADGWYRIITYGNTGRRFPSQVTHWMRLPKPPCC